MWLRIKKNLVQPEQEEEDSSAAWRSEVLLVLFAGENVEWKINGRCITLCYSFHIFHLVLSFVSGLVATATTGATLKMVDKQIDEYNQNKKKMITDVPE
jgi:hypothetical protein